jgi:DUF4097 and DUF4098 domain-containing protein YvlB
MLVRRAVMTGLVVVSVAACAAQQGTHTNHKDSKTFPSASGKLVVLDIRSLDAEIEVVAGDSITVAVELEAHSSSRAAARRWVERNTPVMDDSPTRLEISTPRRGSVSVIGFIETEGVIKVKVPTECKLELRTASGDVTLRGEVPMTTPVRIDTSSGDVTVRGGARELLLDTSSGDIRVTGPALAVLEADTASGDVVLDAGADRVVIDTSSGDSELRNLRGALSLSATSGDVDARWLSLAAGTRIRVETQSGEVTLRLATGSPITGEVKSSSGSIESEFPGEEDRRGQRFTLSGAQASAESAPGAGTGTAELSIRTGSGRVRLLEATPEI